MALAFFANMIAVYAFFSWVPLVLTSVGFALDQAVRDSGPWILRPRRHRGQPAQRLAYLAHRLASAAGAGGKHRDIRPGRADLRGRVRPRCAARHGYLLRGHRRRRIRHPRAADRPVHRVGACLPDRWTSGVGFASGAGRIGGILSSFAGGALLAAGGAAGFFVGIAIVLLLAVAGLLALRRHLPR